MAFTLNLMPAAGQRKTPWVQELGKVILVLLVDEIGLAMDLPQPS
jgi:hypothetical protein